MGAGQGGKADDGVHGRADIVGHVGEEHALGLAGPVGLGESILQEHLFLHLLAGLVVHVAEAQHHAVVILPGAGPHRLHLKEPDLLAAQGPVVEVGDILVRQLLQQERAGQRPAQAVPVLLTDAAVYVAAQAFLHVQLSVHKDVVQHVVAAVVDPQGTADAGVQIKKAHQVVVHAQRLYQLHLAALLIHTLLLLLKLLGRDIQEEALVKQLALLLHQLDIAHHMEDIAALVAHAVLDAHVVAHLFQRLDAGAQPVPVLIQHRGCHGVESGRQHLLPGLVAQYAQRGPVDADDVLAVQRVAHDAAVHGGEKGLQLTALADDLLLVGPLLGHVNGHAHGAHHAAVQIIQRGLVGGQQPRVPSGLDHLLGHAGVPLLHDDPLRLDAGGIVLLHIPYVGVAPALHLLLGLVDRPAEAVVHLLVDSVLCLVPDQVGDAVDGGLQEVAGLPEVLAQPPGLLPAPEAKAQLRLRQRQGPDVVNGGQVQKLRLGLVREDDQLRLRPLQPGQTAHRLRVQAPHVGQDHIRLHSQRLLRLTACPEGVGEMLQRLQPLDDLQQLPLMTNIIKTCMTAIHICFLPNPHPMLLLL